MANRIVGNVFIIDAAGTLDTQPSTGRSLLKVNAVGFLSINTTGRIRIASGTNTANVVIDFAAVPTAHNPASQSIWTGGINLEGLQAVTVTAGTAYLYLA